MENHYLRVCVENIKTEPLLKRPRLAEVLAASYDSGEMAGFFWDAGQRQAPGLSTWRGGYHRRYEKKKNGNGKNGNGVKKRTDLYTACRLTGEKLFFDDTEATIAVDTTPVTHMLNNIDLGSGTSQRTGRRVEMISLYLRITFALGATETSTVIRYIIFYDKQTNGALLGASDIIDANTVTAHLNMDNRQRFEVLRDKTITMNLLVDTSPQFVFRKEFIKLRCRDVIYNGTAGGVADINTGGLFIMLLSNIGVGATAPIGAYTARLRYRA